MSTEREKAIARYRKCLALRDVHKRQLAEAEQDLAMATDALVVALYGEGIQP